VARKAVERRPTTPSGRVSYKFTVALPRDLAERLTARAIREGRASKGSLRKSSRRRRGDAGDISFRIGLTPSRARAGHRLNQADGLGPRLPGRGQPALVCAVPTAPERENVRVPSVTTLNADYALREKGEGGLS
jgi:hypothetical protein